MRRLLLSVGLLAVLALVATAGFAVTAAEAPESATLDQCMDKKTAVQFPHAAHWEVTACTTCHHTQEGLEAGSDMEVQRCVTCHQNPESAETPDCSQMSLSKNPYHISCVGCHKESSAGPTKCDECHPKAG